MIKELFQRWPVVRQMQTGGDGTGPEAMSQRTRNLLPKNQDAEVNPLHLPLLRSRLRTDGFPQGWQTDFDRGRSRLADFARPSVPQGRGHLRTAHPSRAADEREVSPAVCHRMGGIDLETAMDMVADRYGKAASGHLSKKQDGETVMHTKAVAHLGGATLDNEENYLIKKLFCGVWAWFASATRPAYDTAPPCPVWAHRSDAAAPPRRSTDLANADAILIMGSSMAENHPVGFQWVMAARERGANDHSRRSALHAHLGNGGHLGAAARRHRHSVPRRLDPLRARERQVFPRVRRSTTPTRR